VRGLDEQALEPAGRIEVVAGPDHPRRRRTGLPVLAPEVATHRIDQPGVGQLVTR
jgi:hypothetical protein